MRTLEYFGRISEEYCICYADANSPAIPFED